MLRVAQVVRRVRVNKDGRTTLASEGLAAPGGFVPATITPTSPTASSRTPGRSKVRL